MSCNRPNPEFTDDGLFFANIVINKVANKNATARPTTGETIIPVTTFCIPPKIIACVPAPTIPAPIIPPINAWLLDVGSPNNHVIISQIIAPARAPITIFSVTKFGSMIPFPIVVATATPKRKGPAKFAAAAIATAWSGRMTLVPTTVAIEFAASWNPFKKSKTSAAIIAPMASSIIPSNLSIF